MKLNNEQKRAIEDKIDFYTQIIADCASIFNRTNDIRLKMLLDRIESLCYKRVNDLKYGIVNPDNSDT